MSYRQNDMIYHDDYQWSKNEAKAIVHPSNVFDPSNGNIILYLINLLSQNLFESNVLEIILHEYIPNTVSTIKGAIEWIREKGDFYYKKVLYSFTGNE